MTPEHRTFVVEMARREASLFLENAVENFLDHEAFDPRPRDRASLQAAWEAFNETVDEPWWHLWEAVSDELDEADHDEAKALLIQTFDEMILIGLGDHLGIG